MPPGGVHPIAYERCVIKPFRGNTEYFEGRISENFATLP
ncbi:hypothetical protein LCGC14_1441570, partial [marine sediment metagenome]